VELAGVDVILVHRLLKNSVAADQYLLLTESAHRDLDFADTLSFAEATETYEDIGLVRTRVHVPGNGGERSSMSAAKRQIDDVFHHIRSELESLPFAQRFARNWRLYWKFWFAPISEWSRGHRRHFHHLTDSVSVVQRVAFALLVLLLTPLIIPVGGSMVLWQSLQVRGRS
jgi:hypothetical protein